VPVNSFFHTTKVKINLLNCCIISKDKSKGVAGGEVGFDVTEKVSVQSKHNLQLADANKIPLWRNWAQAMLIFEEAPLIFPILFTFALMPFFCIIKLVFYK
jgi:hypothetical protein